MQSKVRIEQALERAVSRGETQGCPALLAASIRHAVFPGGARIRPQLCIAVAEACNDDEPLLADAAAASIELLHCASLVHDDLPCFDDATMRRGVASVHHQFGERIAVLTGDALIVLAFQTLALGAAQAPARLAPLLGTIASGVGMPFGIVAGQAWECEPQVDLSDYQRAKTGALFAAATVAGAQAAGARAESWREFGERLGEAYQVADDIRDAAADAGEIGKPTWPRCRARASERRTRARPARSAAPLRATRPERGRGRPAVSRRGPVARPRPGRVGAAGAQGVVDAPGAHRRLSLSP